MFSKKTRILIIDDIMSARIWGKNQLAKLGFSDFYEAQDGLKALEIIKDQLKKDRPIELILSDWKMPECDGLELFRHLQLEIETKKIPFMMISAEPQAKDLLSQINSKTSCYLTKPITAEILKRKLEILWENISRDDYVEDESKEELD